MATWVKCAKASDVAAGTLREVPCGNRTVCLANVNGTIHAIDNVCSHAEASLADGALIGTMVECPLHGAQFDVTSGACTQLPATEPVASYPVKVEENEVYVDIG